MTEFVSPPRTFTGPGSRSRLADLVPDDASDVHVVTDEGVANAGVVDAVRDQLPVEPTVHTDVPPNPDRETVLSLSDRLVAADFAVGVGGGSPMDATKAACIAPTVSAATTDPLDLSPEISLDHLDRRVPFVLVPTTSGTGTETGYWAVVSDHDRAEKRSIGHPSMLADAAVLDPELTLSLPPVLTAATGFDVLTHAIESLTASGATELTLPYSRHAYDIARESLRAVVADGDDLAARESLQQASYLAGVAMNNAGLGAVHAVSHALGGVHDLPHGHLNAMLLPAVVRRNGERDPGARARYATLVESARRPHVELADRVERLRRDVGLQHLPDVPEDWQLEIVAETAVDNLNMKTNPFEYDEDAVVSICRHALPDAA
ncbi:iron-containing alcohol dehydrogenase family protein [Halosolutus amylolyticus]|uniref:Iron-containing alcohol dehydrogenase family protein n=1 Tax=Halosolutus amylolyticus TaxID=2932267 RepID=A0ABD5PPK5_9EURY|nr:iron-containing alcohol dehydrogenase [Halosolutus amylolyticus]